MPDIDKPNMQALWADQGAIIAPTDAKVRLGWVAEVPPNQWENWVQNRQDRALAYLMQKGIPEWDSETEYIANKSFVQKDGKIYKCIATNTGNDPATRSTFWDSGIGLGLGTAAYADLTTSDTDTVGGRVLKTGDYGLGFQSAIPTGAGISTLPVGGNYHIPVGHPDVPAGSGGSLYVGGASSLKTYLYIQNNTRKVYVKSDTSQWAELWSGLNFNPSDKADKTTTISAGTGLSGGGDLSQNRSLSVVYGTTANTVAAGNDSRITGAVQRSELGTAATRDVTTSKTDTSAGRVLKVGDFGLGGTATLVSGDWNDVNVSGVYMGLDMLNSPPWGGWAMVQCYQHNPRYTVQVAYDFSSGTQARMAIRRKNSDVWEDWLEVYHSGNFVPGTAATLNKATVNQAQAMSTDDAVITPKKLADAFLGANRSTEGNSGFQRLPGGLIFQWTLVSDVPHSPGPDDPGKAFLWPIAYPNRCILAWSTHIGTGITSTMVTGLSPTGATAKQVRVQSQSTGPASVVAFSFGV